MTIHALLALFTLCAGHPLGSGTPASGHSTRNLPSLGGDWAHPAHHPAVALFRRQDEDVEDDVDDTSSKAGSDAWYDRYPKGTPDVNSMPQAWKDALSEAENAGLIPELVQSEPSGGRYPRGINAGGNEYCNSAAGCRADGDIWDAPDGMIGISFDDGPTPSSPHLYNFLVENNQSATHFFIGQNILAYPDIFRQAFNNGDAIAVHTWTHPFMTSRTNAQIVTEFGWTLQIVSDLTGGRVPKYWRPPYGDSDNRVRAIAKHIFGLTQVDWNRDTADWRLPNHNGVTQQSIASNLAKWITGPKSPGLMILEHELYNGTVQAFIDAYPSMKANGWDVRSIPDLYDDNRQYQNAEDGTSDVASLNFVRGGQTSIDLTLTSPGTSSAPASQSSTAVLGGQPSSAAPRVVVNAPLVILVVALILVS